MMDTNSSQYTHLETKTKKCTMCNKSNELIRLPDEFQVYARRKNFESFFCGNCVQIVNFVRS